MCDSVENVQSSYLGFVLFGGVA
uniref:Uncharacterized protein n=1 Tax=Rhizophora mucronata TaxID=61149 RepID=A0A2P2L2G9_RHIMU